MPDDDTDDRIRWQRALDALPIVPRTVFVLHAWDEWSFSEIAHRVGLSTQEVEEQLAEALVQLNCQVGPNSSHAPVARRAPTD